MTADIHIRVERCKATANTWMQKVVDHGEMKSRARMQENIGCDGGTISTQKQRAPEVTISYM